MCYGTCMQVRGRLVGVVSLFCHMDSGYQKALELGGKHLFTEPSCWPKNSHVFKRISKMTS